MTSDMVRLWDDYDNVRIGLVTIMVRFNSQSVGLLVPISSHVCVSAGSSLARAVLHGDKFRHTGWFLS